MKIHEERDELLAKVERLNAEKRELERQLADVRRQLTRPERAVDLRDE